MARRVIATAEVQVAADVKKAEAGIEGLTSAFRGIGRSAERAAERAEVAMFAASGKMRTGFNRVTEATEALLSKMEQGDRLAKEMAAGLRQTAAAAQRVAETDLDEGAIQALRAFKELVQVAYGLDRSLLDASVTTRKLAEEIEQVAQETKLVEQAAERTANAFRDVGQAIDLVAAGGLDELKSDVNQTIGRLREMGDQGRAVAQILGQSFFGILGEFKNDAEAATAALFRLKRAADGALDNLDTGALQEVENSVLEVERRAYQLGQAFRNVGQDIEMAMSGGIGGLKDDITQSIRRLVDMGDKGFDVARILERSFDGVLSELENDTEAGTAALFRLKRAADSALSSLDEAPAAAALRAMQELQGETRAAEIRAEMLGKAFRNVGQDIDVAMAGGLQQVQDDISATLGRLSALGGGFRETAAIGQSSFDDILDELPADTDRATAALVRLLQKLRDIEQIDIAANALQEMEGAIRAAEIRAEMLGKAFRDVGQDIDLAMAGGLEQVQDDIRDTIRRLKDLGGEFKDVGAIGERALDDIATEADENLEQAASAAMRLAQQLRNVEQVELNRLAAEAKEAAAALNQTAVAASRADRAIDGMGNVVNRARGNVSGLVGVLGAAGLGYAAFSAAKAGLDMTRQLEKSEAMFLGLTGSVEGAADMLERMVMFARETPYNLASVSEAAAQLLAIGDDFGVTTQNVEKYLTTFGDAITMTGGSEDQFIRIVRVLGQMSSTGKVLGQDMNQLAQNLPGYDVWQQLADGAGTSVAELRRLQDIGQLDNLLTGNKAVEILIEGMEGIPGAAGAMERRMNTLGGAIEKFVETAEFAMVQGLEPFSETLQDTLSDPVILNSVEDLSFAFGDLLSKALEDVRPELDDLGASIETLLIAFEDWTPVLVQAADALGDFIDFVSPFVSFFGKATEAVLGFGDGLGKMGVAAALAATGNPFGIAAGAVLAVSGAVDFFADSNEDAANMARLLFAAQKDVNAAMAVGEEVVISDAQQLALNTATELTEKYPELTRAMGDYGVNVRDLTTSMDGLATGTGYVAPELQKLIDSYTNFPDPGDKVMSGLDDQVEAYRTLTDVASEETEKQADLSWLAAGEEIAAEEAWLAALDAYTEQEAKNWDYVAGVRQEAADKAAELAVLSEEDVETLTGLLEEQADAYQEWADGIDGSTEGAGQSMSDFADEFDNDIRRMITAQNEQNAAISGWKGNIVTAASTLISEFGVSETAASNFMARLGEIGPEFAPAVASMVDGSEEGKQALLDFFTSTEYAAGVNSTSLTDELDKVTGAVPGLGEALAEGTLTIEGLLAQLPQAMSDAGLDLETAAGEISIADEMGLVGTAGVDGLVNALNSAAALARVKAAGTALAATGVSAVAGTYQVSSPSRVMFEIGEFVVEGLVLGMQSMSEEAYTEAVQTASLISGGIEEHFREAEDPQEEARKFAKDVAESIIEELIAEQEAVADAAEALAEAAADRLAEAWDRVKDRFKNRDIADAVAEAQAELLEARAELASAESLAGAEGSAAMSAAESRVARARDALAEAEAADTAADLLADTTLKDFQRNTQDAVAALQDQQDAAVAALEKQQENEVTAIQARIDAAQRNLDPVARAAAQAELAAAEERQEADLAATRERHEAEMTLLERRREDEEEALQLRLDGEDKLREASIKAKEDELDAFEDALDDIVDSIQEAIENLPDLRQAISDSEVDLQGAFFDQFEKLLDNVNSVDRGLLESIGARAGLTATEVTDLIDSASASSAASAGATAANLGVGQLLDLLSTGLYTIGADGALGIAAGLSDGAYEIAYALRESVQAAIASTLSALEIRSPSGVTERLIGAPMAEGIAAGLMSAQGAVSSAMNGLVDNVVGGVKVPSSSQLVGGSSSDSANLAYRGPLVTMPNAIIQDATDADLVAQRVVVALAATGVDI